MKSRDSYLRKRGDGAEIFAIRKPRHADYWRKRAFPVLLVIRTSDGETRWMEIRDYPKRESDGGQATKRIVFDGERLDVMSARRWRARVLGNFTDRKEPSMISQEKMQRIINDMFYPLLEKELITALDYIRWGASRFNEMKLFFGHGADNAVDEALTLVRHALYLPPDAPTELFRGRLGWKEKGAILELFTRRIQERIPAAYLTREAWFAGIRLYVDERVLIPRSPIAEWIGRGFAPWVEDPDSVGHILDLGAGSGCLAIAAALAFPEARVDATDISSDALAVAKRNVVEHGLQDRIRIIESNLFAATEIEGPYDIILGNPPYVDAQEIATMPPEYRHEPRIALAAGKDGLACVAPILRKAGGFLPSKGILVLEVGASRPALEKTFPNLPLTWLDLESGGENVFLITGGDLRHAFP
uniref:Ribosomal protein L3 glutamine methyltransferase n=1 Tax=Candidatus Kentrum sp. TC TaxID=2126339 RepID=A0A450ZHF5_9GAMM|nr:MAG: ribosomal protein L3 glutamine methyltransferase [Candidatus Kentron sp. TC]